MRIEKKNLPGITVSRQPGNKSGVERGKPVATRSSSMGDAVSSAAEVLGIAEEDIQARLSAFEVQAQRKSALKTFGAEEQEEQLNAVFSSIFDGPGRFGCAVC